MHTIMLSIIFAAPSVIIFSGACILRYYRSRPRRRYWRDFPIFDKRLCKDELVDYIATRVDQGGNLSVKDLANILAIYEKVVQLIGEDKFRSLSGATKVSLQDPGPMSLRWSDDALKSFLDGTILPKFGIALTKKQIKSIFNGSSSTVGDLSIAILLAIQRDHRPRIPMNRSVSRR